MRLKQLFLLLFLLIPPGMEAMPGTYKGGKILTDFGRDSFEVNGRMHYFNLDSLFYRIVTEGYTPEVQNINVHYFVDIVDHMDEKRQLSQIGRFREAGHKYNSRSLQLEADFISIWYSPESTDSLSEIKAGKIENMIVRMQKEGEVEFEVRLRELLCHHHWKREQYVRPFSEFPIIDRLLDRIPDINPTGVNAASKKKFYYWFGQCYYLFADFDQAIYYYEKATVDPSEYVYEPFHRYDATNLLAHIALGRYYREKEDLDTSDSHFRSMLESPDSVSRREMFEAIAWCNLGENMRLRGEHEEAIRIMRAYVPVLIAFERYSLASEIAVSLGESYVSLGQLDNVCEMIDTASYYISLAGGDKHLSQSYAFAARADHLPSLYRLKSKYYAQKNDTGRFKIYLDSSVYYQKEINHLYSSRIIRYAEQILHATEKHELEQEKKVSEMHASYLSMGLVLVFISLVVYIYLYRRKKKAYRALTERTRQWAEWKEETPQPVESNITLFEKMEQLFRNEQIHLQPDITLESVAQRMDVNRTYLSQSVNRCSGKNFTTYVNELRIKEAVRIMSKTSNLSLEGIAFESGFNDRKTFYRAFKKTTGLSPSEFRNNLKK